LVVLAEIANITVVEAVGADLPVFSMPMETI
jgi:hypothetical protein